ncbi:DUF5057 domain-containing protein [Paenibacillus dakarensis]|uniref:DUF5057 domain-containing protein n=1 Tax=Paenibacillus dakarensis TaxID=1527293 RepID=UPI0006D56653|nr:DUF5057 domain-containing protein [Paenibacillus dakarensis]
MKRYRRIGWIVAAAFILILLILPIRDFLTRAEAEDSGYTIRILEVTENGSTDLGGLKSGTRGVTVDTMSMKRFVSLRTDLDGKYDAIYIGKGKYSKSGVKGTDHNTAGVMNDITKLKAKAIIDHYINKGLYVFLHTDPFINQKTAERGNLYESFNLYRTPSTAKSNVVFVGTEELNKIVEGIKNGTSRYLPGLKQRPRLEITNKSEIREYSTDTTHHIYQIGDELTYKIHVSNVKDFKNRPITANLYMSVDKSIAMTADHLVASTTLDNSSSAEMKYKLPKTYSGVLYWKLEIVDQLNPYQWKDYDSGSIRFHGKKTIVNILQVLPRNEGKQSSSLLNSANMNPGFLKSDDYELKIETKTIDEFNNYIKTNYTASQQYGLNGTYDMLIFGFADIYNTKAPISSLAADAVVEFSEKTKQSVMFTHDTIYASTAEWMSKFQTITGQIPPQTNLGLNAPNTSKLVTPVNDGLLTQYPFNLSKKTDDKPIYQVATTHNQYFTLNLEDPNIIPWYNIEGSNRDVNDSWNHYYTYSKGNVTYSGTGHIFTGSNTEKFPEWEQKLFVNTMYRAFTGANHAPEITVRTPEDNSVHPSYQENLMLSYTVDDWDLKDRNLLTSIKFKKDNAYIRDMTIKDMAIISGQTVTQGFKNPLPDGGELQIEISAWDKQGAMTTKTIKLTIRKAAANLKTERSLSPITNNNEVKRDEEVTVDYKVTPNSIPYDIVAPSDQGKDTLVITNIQYTETFPPNFEITGLPEGTTKTGTLATGYTIGRSLGDVTYKLNKVNGVNKSYEPQNPKPITFQIKGKPKTKGVYLLDHSKIEFEDIHASIQAGGSQGSSNGDDSNSTLGIPKGFVMFILDDIYRNPKENKGFSSDGGVAGGGNVDLIRFSLAGGNNSNKYIIIAGKDIQLGGGSVPYGKKIAYGGSTIGDVSNFEKILVKDNPIDFNSIKNHLLRTSASIAQLPATADPVISNNGSLITLTGTNPKLNVFHIAGSKLANSRNFTIHAPSGSTVIVNIDGSQVEMHNGLTLRGVDAGHVLYNYYEATDVLNSGISVLGTVLAPKAHYSLEGNIFGSIIADKMTTGGNYLSLRPFEGDLGITPEPLNRITVDFPTLSFTSVVKVSQIDLNGAKILVGTEQQLIPTVLPEDADNKLLTWESLKPNTVSVSGEGIIHGLQEGKAQIKVSATDGSGIYKIVEVEVINRGLTISGPDTAKVQDELQLEARYTTTGEQVTGYRWSVKPVNGHDVSDMVRLRQDAAGLNIVKITALKKGTVTLIATVLTDQFPDGVLSAEHTITISEKLDEIIIEGPNRVYVGGSVTLNLITNPAGVEETGFQWSILGDGASYVKLTPASDGQSAQITGLKKTDLHKVTVKVTTPWTSNNIEDIHDIVVVPALTGLRLDDATVSINGTEDLFNNLSVIPSDFNKYELKGQLNWKSSDESTVSIDEHGVITGRKKGTSQVSVTYMYEINGKTVKIKAQATIKVSGTYSKDKY